MSGKYVFVGVSEGLAAFSTCDFKDVSAWDAAKTEICAIHALDLGNECHVLLAVDEMGSCAVDFLALAGDNCALELNWQLHYRRVLDQEEHEGG